METTERNNPPPDEDRHNSTTATSEQDGSAQAPREPNELDNGIAKEIAQLDDEGVEALISLLQTLRAEGIRLTAATVAGYTVGAKMALDSFARQEKKQEAVEEYRCHRDNLPEPERIEYMVERLRKYLGYTAVFKRCIMQRLLGEPVDQAYEEQFGKHLDTVVQETRKDFEGTTPEFQRKVCHCYIEVVLPEAEAEEQAEDAIEKAHDGFAQLLDGKSVEEIRALTQQLKTAS